MSLRDHMDLLSTMRFVFASVRIKNEVDQELGNLLLNWIDSGDDSILSRVHDRMNIIGRFDDADWLRKIIQENQP